MPSWRVHRDFYEKLCREGLLVWTPKLLERIDRIIDKEYGEHDLGRGPDLESFQKLVRALWLEFGDVYDSVTRRFLKAGLLEKLEIERRALLEPYLQRRYLIYIPDDVLVLTILHHILDVATYYLLNTYPPIGIDDCALLFERTKASLRDFANRLREFQTEGGSPFNQVLENLIEALKKRCCQVYEILVQYLRSKNLEPGYGPEVLLKLLQDFVSRKGYYGIVYVNDRPLPVAAAARKAFAELVKGGRVVLGFSMYRVPYPPICEKVEASSVRELCEKLRTAL
jgi:hypothetical protein